MPFYDPDAVAKGRDDLKALAEDTKTATTYGDNHLESLGRRDGGLIYSHFLSGHKESVEKCDGLITGSKTLLTNAATKMDSTIKEYGKTEKANVDLAVAQIWSVLQAPPGTKPLGPPPPGGGVTPGPMPSSELTEPQAVSEHWIWNVLSWPDYLSAGSWIRKIFAAIFQGITGTEPWQWLWEWLGGDYAQIGKVADAWSHLSDFFDTMSEEVGVRMQIMFAGWYDSDAATSAGSYFAQAVMALDAAQDPLSQLAQKYRDVEISSFGFFQAIFSAIDAAIDAIIAFLLGGTSVLEAIAAFFSGGATAVPAAVTAVIAAVEAVSAAWGWMMTAVYAILGFAALLGAACTEVTWVTLPEG